MFLCKANLIYYSLSTVEARIYDAYFSCRGVYYSGSTITVHILNAYLNLGLTQFLNETDEKVEMNLVNVKYLVSVQTLQRADPVLLVALHSGVVTQDSFML